MFKKTFAEILKENLGDDSFKPPPPAKPKPIRKIFGEITDEFLLEIKKYYITVKDIERVYGSRSFYKNLFKEPVKRIFYWCEEDWQGCLFVIFHYKNRYIYVSGYFGSCEVCDAFPQDEESLERAFRNVHVCDNLNDITLGYNPEFVHPELIKDFEKFKSKMIKTQHKKLQIFQKNQQIKVQNMEGDNKQDTTQNTIQNNVSKTMQENTQENTQDKSQNTTRVSAKVITSWASLFK